MQEVIRNNIPNIDIVVCNVYAFDEVVASQASHSVCLANIDSGGCALIRSAASNYEHVTVLTSETQYAKFMEEMNSHNMTTTMEFRNTLAVSNDNNIMHNLV